MLNSVCTKVDNVALPSPLSSAKGEQDVNGTTFSSPSRKVRSSFQLCSTFNNDLIQAKKVISYAESGEDEDEEEEDFVPTKPTTTRKRLVNKRNIISDDDEDDEFGMDGDINDGKLSARTYDSRY